MDANNCLMASYSKEEMGPTKAPGEDGFLTLFFQQYWHIVGCDITKFYLGILNEWKGMESIN